MGRIRNRLNKALREIRPWPVRIDLGLAELTDLRGSAAAHHFAPGTYRNVTLRVRPRLKGWKVVAESGLAATLALRRPTAPVEFNPMAPPASIESADFDETLALQDEMARRPRRAEEDGR